MDRKSTLDLGGASSVSSSATTDSSSSLSSTSSSSSSKSSTKKKKRKLVDSTDTDDHEEKSKSEKKKRKKSRFGDRKPELKDGIAESTKSSLSEIDQTDTKTNNNDVDDEITEEKMTRIGCGGIMNPLTLKPYSDRYQQLLKDRSKLPVNQADQRKEFIRAYQQNQIVVLVGETGSGKTTQIPQLLVELGYADSTKMVACTQPRRVAATSVAKRVSEEMDVSLGEEVGYSIRFDNNTTQGKTVLKYMTDGMLLREAQKNPSLDNYSCIIIDEAHERSVSTDVLMGLLKEMVLGSPEVISQSTDDTDDVKKNKGSSDVICKAKKATAPHLKLVVMSATLDAAKFQEYFDGAPLIKVPGRMHPVEIFYTQEPEKDYLEACVRTVLQIHVSESTKEGDILVFLTGSAEIDKCVDRISEQGQRMFAAGQCGPLMVLPLYSALPPDKQQLIFSDPPVNRNPGSPFVGRKVVVSTNIAETSLTIDGVVYVVDSGFTKQKIYNPRIRSESLCVTPISQASAKQRAGRAGRTKPGKAFRLYTEKSFAKDLQLQTYPEILRCNLSTTVLSLLKLGVSDLVHFDFMDPPSPESLMRALELLNYLGALDDEGNLTDFGDLLAEFPLDPQLSTCLIKSSDDLYQCSNEMCSIVALLSVPPIYYRPPGEEQRADNARAKFNEQMFAGDHLAMLNIYDHFINEQYSDNSYRFCQRNYLNHRSLKAAENVRRQLASIMRRLQLPMISPSKDISEENQCAMIRKALCEGFFMQVAHSEGSKGHYLTVKDNQVVRPHPSTNLNHCPEWLIFHEFVFTSQNFMRNITQIEGKWLLEIAPNYYNVNHFPDGSAKRALNRLHNAVKRRKNYDRHFEAFKK